MGHPLLTPSALPHGVSIYAGVAGAMIPAFQIDSTPIPSDLSNERMLEPLPSRQRQTITSLTPEPRPPVGDQWINLTPTELAAMDQMDRDQRRLRTRKRPDALPEVVAMTMNMETLTNATMNMETLTNAHFASPQASISDIHHCFETLLLSDDPSEIPLVTPIEVPNSYHAAKSHTRHLDWQRAMEQQMKSLLNNDTWEVVDLPLSTCILPNK